VACRFEALQLDTGQIVLFCYSPPNTWTPADHLSRFENVARFEGRTDRGELHDISATGPFVHFTTSPEWARKYAPDRELAAFHVRTLRASRSGAGPTSPEADWLSFGVTNFTLFGGALQELTPKLPLGGAGEERTVVIKPLGGFAEISDRIRVTGGVQVTCQIRIPIRSHQEVDSLTDDVGDICSLLSIAQGCGVNWIYRETLGAGGLLIERLHCDRITKRYSPMKLVGLPVEPFVEKTYSLYRERKGRWLLDRGVVDGYLEAKQQADFLEARGAKAATSMERIATIAGGRARTLRGKISNVLGDLGLHIPEHEIGFFIECRNSLLHSGYFYCDQKGRHRKKYPPLSDHFDEYLFMVHLMDQVVLKIIGYSGRYINCRKQPWVTCAELP
jgi:hypothetical protein